MSQPEQNNFEADFAVYMNKRLYFDYKYGDAILQEGFPMLCAKHHIKLVFERREDGNTNLMCPEGDTLYVLRTK